MHVTLSPTQQVILIHEEGHPGEFTVTVNTSDGTSQPFQMVLIDGTLFAQLGETKIDFQDAKGSLSATVSSEGEEWYLVARADTLVEVDIVTSTLTPTSLPPPAANQASKTPIVSPINEPLRKTAVQSAPADSSPAPINWMLIAAIALVVLLVGYFIYTQFLAPKPSGRGGSGLRTL